VLYQFLHFGKLIIRRITSAEADMIEPSHTEAAVWVGSRSGWTTGSSYFTSSVLLAGKQVRMGIE
jgi:hypothetical protein